MSHLHHINENNVGRYMHMLFLVEAFLCLQLIDSPDSLASVAPLLCV